MWDFFLFDEMPWLRDAFTWFLVVVLFVAAWFVLSGPAFLLRDVLQRLNAQLWAFIERRRNEDQERLQGFRRGLRGRFQSFFASHQLIELHTWDARVWRANLRKLASPIRESANRIRRMDRALDRLARNTEKLGETTTEKTAPYTVHPLPDSDVIASRREEATKWFIALCFSGPLILAIAVVNAGVLSRVLQEMEIGQFPLAGGLRGYHVMAVMLTFIEAGVGVWWGVGRFSSMNGDSDVISLGSLLPPVFATALAGVEGFFYSRFGVEAQTPPLDILGFEFHMQSAFFLLGFSLPWVLFALGDILYRAIVSYRSCHIPRTLMKELRRSTREASRREGQLKAVESQLSRVRTEGQRALALLPRPIGTSAPDLPEALGRVEAAISDLQERRPSWLDLSPVKLSEAELDQYAFRVAGALLLVVAAALLSTWIHSAVLPDLFFSREGPDGEWTSSLSPWMGAAISLAKAASLLAAGLFLRARSVAIDSGGEIQPLYGVRARGTQLAGMAIAGTILAFDVWQLIGPSTPAPYRLAWGAVLVADIALVLLGRELPSMLALAAPALGAAIDALGLFLRSMLRRLLSLLAALLAVVVGAVQVLAEPWDRSVARRR